MALPATGVSLSAVNTELVNTSTATVNLNDIVVRSLGSNLTTGSQFGMSGLASQSITWTQMVYLTNGNARFASLMPFVDETCYYELHAVDTTVGETYTGSVQVRKLYLNGQTAQVTALQSTSLASSEPAGLGASGMGPQTNSDIYTWLVGPTLVRINSAGIIQAQKRYTINGFAAGPTQERSIGVDAAGNAYFGYVVANNNMGQQDHSGIISVDPSLNIRWAIRFQNFGSNPFKRTAIRDITCDASGNVWVKTTEIDFSTTWQNGVGLIRLNTSGTILSRVAFTTNTGTGGSNSLIGSYVYSTAAGYSISAREAPDKISVSFYNSAGTLQWVRRVSIVEADEFPAINGGCSTDSSGNVYVVTGSRDIVRDEGGIAVGSRWTVRLLKINSAGTLQWQRRIRMSQAVGTTQWNFAQPMEKSQPIYFSRSNDSRVTIGFAAGYLDDYSWYTVPFIMTINADGSGTGTYSLGTFDGFEVVVIYEATTDLSLTTASQTSMTPLAASAPPTIVTVATTDITNVTPQTPPAPRTNI
jgi:hypothetical protein